MRLDLLMGGQISKLDLILFVTGVLLSIFFQIFTIHRKDRSHFFWKYKKTYEKVVIMPLLILTYIFVRLMFLFNYYGSLFYLQIEYGIHYFYAVLVGLIVDGLFWLIANRLPLFEDEPLMFKHVMYYLIEFMTIGPLMLLLSNYLLT